MKRPHEQEWSVRITKFGPVVSGGEGIGPISTLSRPPAELHLSMDAAYDLQRERARLIAMSPRTVRALLRLYRAFPKAHATEEEAEACNEACEVLRANGVLP